MTDIVGPAIIVTGMVIVWSIVGSIAKTHCLIDDEVKKNRAELETWLKDDRVFLSPGDKGYCCNADAPRDMYCDSCDKQGNIFLYKPWARRFYKGPCDRYKASEDDVEVVEVEVIDGEYREIPGHQRKAICSGR